MNAAVNSFICPFYVVFACNLTKYQDSCTKEIFTVEIQSLCVNYIPAFSSVKIDYFFTEDHTVVS